LALHRSRQSFIKQRTAQANQIRVIGRIWHCRPRYPAATATITELVEDADNPLPVLFRTQLSLLQHHMAYLFVSLHSTSRLSSAIGKNLCQRIGRSLVLALLPPAR
jgi:hypothetical protein